MGNNRSMETFREKDFYFPDNALVIVNDFETSFSIGQLAYNIYLIEDLSENPKEVDTELFLLNLDSPRAVDVTTIWFQWGRPRVNYWATFENWEKVKEFINAFPELTIERVEYDDYWIKVVASKHDSDSLHSTSFLQGLEVLRGALRHQDPIDFEARISEPSFRKYLISRTIPLAKPIKRFLPHKLVIYIYKLLERLR